MNEDQFETTKSALLGHMRTVFEEISAEVARTHEEKYALLEDAVNNATDLDELRVAFEQWYADHAADIELEYEADELWDVATALE